MLISQPLHVSVATPVATDLFELPTLLLHCLVTFAILLFALLRVLVRLHVLCQVIGPHEPFTADGAGEPLLAGVRPQVPLELVRPGEALAAEEPVADERALARVPAKVGLQVRGLTVDLVATGIVADVELQKKFYSKIQNFLFDHRKFNLKIDKIKKQHFFF